MLILQIALGIVFGFALLVYGHYILGGLLLVGIKILIFLRDVVLVIEEVLSLVLRTILSPFIKPYRKLDRLTTSVSDWFNRFPYLMAPAAAIGIFLFIIALVISVTYISMWSVEIQRFLH